MARIVRHKDTKEILFITTEDNTDAWLENIPLEDQEDVIEDTVDVYEAAQKVQDAALAKLPVDSDPRTADDTTTLVKRQWFTDEDGFDAEPVPLEDDGVQLTGTALVQQKFHEFAVRTGKSPGDPITLEEIGQVIGEAVQEEFG